MIPSDSNYDFPFSPSMSENVDTIAQMLVGNSLSYELEGARFLLEKIREKIKGNSHLEEALEKLSDIVENPDGFDPLTIQQTLGTLRSID
ncbi:MAG: hypothetical protein KDK63_02070 [Chlamydiia bacterium]|nr:hypothetical protein [Chlamydiia bacterium]MCP5505967.1 hypothetical protein [Chlamydiales bacterium]